MLMFFAGEFWFKTAAKTLPEAPEEEKDETLQNAVVVFFQAEEEDVSRSGKVQTKFVKNIKWLAGKFDTKDIVLHSFSHLSSSKAPADFTAEFLSEAASRLENTGYSVVITSYGYLHEWKLHVLGDSLARVFKEI